MKHRSPNVEHMLAPETPLNIDLGGTLKFKGDLAAVMRLDPLAVHEQIAEHSSLFSFFGIMYTEALRHQKRLKRTAKMVRGDAAASIREAFAKEKERLTDEKLKLGLEVHPKVIEADDAVEEAEHAVETLAIILETMRHRKEMLCSYQRVLSASGDVPQMRQPGSYQQVRNSSRRADD